MAMNINWLAMAMIGWLAEATIDWQWP